MAQVKKSKRHASGIKAHRQSEKRQSRNRSAKRAVRLAVRAALDAAKEKNAAKVQELVTQASSVLDKAAKRGSIHWKAAGRKKSRLAQMVKLQLAAQAPAGAK